MPLTTIDGKLYLDDGEFSFLCAIKLMNELDQQQPQVVAEAHAEDDIGYRRTRRQGMSVWPEQYLIKATRRAVASKAYGFNQFGRCELGEQSINGHVYGSPEEPAKYDHDGNLERGDMADLSPAGPASLMGKIALELCRRLEIELNGDDRAARRSYMPRDDPRLEDGQDDPPAEE